MKTNTMNPLLAAAINLVHRDLIKHPDGDHYYELLEAIQSELGGTAVNEIVSAVSALEVATNTLSKTPLLAPLYRQQLNEAVDAVSACRFLHAIRN